MKVQDFIIKIKIIFISIFSVLGIETVTLMEIDLVAKIVIEICIGVATMIYLIKKIKNQNGKS